MTTTLDRKDVQGIYGLLDALVSGQRELAKELRDQSERMELMALDLDNFKLDLDNLKHGDIAELKKMVEQISQMVRKLDKKEPQDGGHE